MAYTRTNLTRNMPTKKKTTKRKTTKKTRRVCRKWGTTTVPKKKAIKKRAPKKKTTKKVAKKASKAPVYNLTPGRDGWWAQTPGVSIWGYDEADARRAASAFEQGGPIEFTKGRKKMPAKKRTKRASVKSTRNGTMPAALKTAVKKAYPSSSRMGASEWLDEYRMLSAKSKKALYEDFLDGDLWDLVNDDFSLGGNGRPTRGAPMITIPTRNKVTKKKATKKRQQSAAQIAAQHAFARKQKAKAKVRKLLALAAGSDGPEATTAAKQAQTLMLREDLSPADVGSTSTALARVGATGVASKRRKTTKKKTTRRTTAQTITMASKKKSSKKKKSTKKKSTKKKTTKRTTTTTTTTTTTRRRKKVAKTTARRAAPKRRSTAKKTSKRRSSSKSAGCPVTASELKTLRSAVTKIGKMCNGRPVDNEEAKMRKARAKEAINRVKEELVAAAACRMGNQAAKARGQTPKRKCPTPPRSVKQSAEILGYERARSAKQKTKSARAMANEFLRS